MAKGEGPAKAAALPRAEAARRVRPSGAERHRAQAGGRADHRGSARRSRSGGHCGPRSTTRTERPRGRCPGPGAAGVRGHRVPPAGPARRVPRRHERRRPRRSLGAAVRHRTDRVHPPDAHRGRACRRGRRRRRRIPFSLSTLGTASVEEVAAANPAAGTGSSSTCGRTATGRSSSCSGLPAPGSTRCSSRSTSRSRARGCATSRNGMTIPPKLRLRTALDAIAGRPGGSTSSPPNARIRVVRPVGGDRRRAARRDVTRRSLRGPRLDQGAVAGQARRQGGPDTRGRAADRVARRRRHHAVEPRRPAARPRARSRSTCCPTSPARSGRTSRCISTPAS